MDCSPDGKTVRRLHAIHLLLIGVSFEHVVRNSRRSERTVRWWVEQFNAAGIDGLIYRPSPGRPRKIAKETVASSILPIVDEPEKAGQTHWTLTKLCGWLREERDLDISYRTLVRYVHEQGYARRIPRPVPEPPDRDSWQTRREEFAEQLKLLLYDKSAYVLFGDEVGFEGDPRPRHKWVKRGSRPTQGYHGGHLRRNVIGAVCPENGEFVSLLVPHCNTEVFQVFLDTLAQEVPEPEGRTVYLVLDNASWHKSARLDWHHIKPVFLPPYSPDFNPIERLWQHLKGQYLAGFITNDGHQLEEKILTSLRDLLDKPKTVQSVCSYPRLNRQ